MTPRRVFPPEGCSGWDGLVVGVGVELLHLVVKGEAVAAVAASGVGLRSWAYNAQGGGSQMACKTVHGATTHAFVLVLILEEKKWTHGIFWARFASTKRSTYELRVRV
jgi:hypothetical protein